MKVKESCNQFGEIEIQEEVLKPRENAKKWSFFRKYQNGRVKTDYYIICISPFYPYVDYKASTQSLFDVGIIYYSI